ncbi:unnamed protein product [Coregonus sp. 'balchen']|nr:unnamed protein product [Coregonus sp. 'balchen']
MGLIETTQGLLPGAGGSQRLPRAVGFALAEKLIFTGRRAVDIGLAPIAVRMAKEAMNRGMELIPTRDRQEGMAAFKE